MPGVTPLASLGFREYLEVQGSTRTPTCLKLQSPSCHSLPHRPVVKSGYRSADFARFQGIQFATAQHPESTNTSKQKQQGEHEHQNFLPRIGSTPHTSSYSIVKQQALTPPLTGSYNCLPSSYVYLWHVIYLPPISKPAL